MRADQGLYSQQSPSKKGVPGPPRPASYVIEEVDEDPNEIKLKFPDLQNSNGGLAIIREPTQNQGYKNGDSEPGAGKRTRIVPV